MSTRGEDGWHIEVCRREWVSWWYGYKENWKKGHIEPAELVLGARDGIGDRVVRIPFSLPDFSKPEQAHNASLEPPVELKRVTCWGARVIANDGYVRGSWELAESKEEAIALVAQDLHRRRNSESQEILDAVNDIRDTSR